MPVPGYVEFSGGPTPFRFIEWLEIKKVATGFGQLAASRVTDRCHELQVVLDSQNLDFEETETTFIVRGYRGTS